MLISLKRVWRAGWLSFRRNGGLSLITIFVMFLAVSLITSIFLSRGVADFLLKSLEKKIDISVYFKESAMEDEIMGVKKLLEDFEGVKKVEYVSQEQALNNFKERHKFDEVISGALEEVGNNPFSASLNINAEDSLKYEAVDKFLLEDRFSGLIDKVDFSQRKPVIEKFYFLKESFEKTGLVAILVLIFVAFSITFIAIRLAIYNASNEIGIMRLVGASNWFIQGPFLIQGVICGLIAAALGIVFFSVLSYFLAPKIFSLTAGFDLFKYSMANIFPILGLQLLSGVGLGIISSLIAIRRYLEI